MVIVSSTGHFKLPTLHDHTEPPLHSNQPLPLCIRIRSRYPNPEIARGRLNGTKATVLLEDSAVVRLCKLNDVMRVAVTVSTRPWS